MKPEESGTRPARARDLGSDLRERPPSLPVPAEASFEHNDLVSGPCPFAAEDGPGLYATTRSRAAACAGCQRPSKLPEVETSGGIEASLHRSLQLPRTPPDGPVGAP